MRGRGLLLASQLLAVAQPLALHTHAGWPPSHRIAHHRCVAARCAFQTDDATGGSAQTSEDDGLDTVVRDLKGLWGRVVGPDVQKQSEELRLDLEPSAADDLEYVPLVLVIGATGQLGRIIVRKLVMQGFKVVVLVRSLSSDTLNLLGSGVSYAYGDITNYRSLLDAMEDVDRVIFAADAEENSELTGLSNVFRSFQDTRTFMYGDAEATKLTLMKTRRDTDFNRWTVDKATEDVDMRLASAGLGPQPSVVHWKRSPTGSHRNGVFVGKVFDTYLGSAAVSCPLSSLLLGGTPISDSALSALDPSDPLVTLRDHKSYESQGTETDRAVAEAAAREVPLDLGEYSGILVRAIGDGNKYTLSLRTASYSEDSIEYQSDFVSIKSTFDTARLPFSQFVPMRNGRRVPDAPELDRRQLVGMSLAFYPQRNDPTQATGEFYLSVANVKAYRKRDEPEIVYISDAGVSKAFHSAEDGQEASDAELDRARTKRRGEELLRRSGLTYFIVRPTELTDEPSSRRLTFAQGGGTVRGCVSRADVAEVAVRSLLDPRACNVACAVTESDSATPSTGDQDISKALEVLEPNRL